MHIKQKLYEEHILSIAQLQILFIKSPLTICQSCLQCAEVVIKYTLYTVLSILLLQVKEENM